MFQTITANFSGKVREAKLDGRNYWVVQTRFLPEGVMDGSQGPVLYRNRDIRRYASAWDMKPIVVHHPTDKFGNDATAADPRIIEKRGVGFMLKNKAQGGMQQCESWIDQKKADKVDSRIRRSIENGLHMEVSCGLEADQQRKRGKWFGTKYKVVARNYRPDHLALLPDMVGACSIADGCGLITSSKAMPYKKMKKIKDAVNRLWKGSKVRNCGCGNKKKGKSDMKTSQKGRRKISANQKRIIDRLIGNGKGEWKESDRKTLRNMDSTVLKKLEASRKRLRLALVNSKKVTKAEKLTNEARERRLAKKRMEKKLHVNGKNRKKSSGVNHFNTKPKSPKTAEEFLKSVPGPMRAMFSNGLRAYRQQRKQLYKIILSNSENKFDKDELKVMEDNVLHKLAAIADKRSNDDDGEEGATMFNYFGQQGSRFNNASEESDSDDDEAVLDLPTTLRNTKRRTRKKSRKSA